MAATGKLSLLHNKWNYYLSGHGSAGFYSTCVVVNLSTICVAPLQCTARRFGDLVGSVLGFQPAGRELQPSLGDRQFGGLYGLLMHTVPGKDVKCHVSCVGLHPR